MKTLAWFWCVVLLPSLAMAACFTPTQLHDEITNDPASLNFASYVSSGSDAEIVTAINLVRAGAGYVVSRGVVTRDVFLGSWSDVIDGIRALSEGATKDKWVWRVEKLLIPKDTIDYSSALTTGFFADMIADGLNGAGGPLDAGDVTDRTTRQGSRAEVLWGSGCVVTQLDVSCALRGACQ